MSTPTTTAGKGSKSSQNLNSGTSKDTSLDEETILKRLKTSSSDTEREQLFRQLPSNTRLMVARSYFSGPLPPPKQLEEYEKILPGAADRILKMAERQSSHRQKMEEMIVRSNTRDSHYGVVFAFLLGLVIICGGIYLASIGHPYGTWFSFGGVATLIGVFVYGTRSSRKERTEKVKQQKNK